ncbi:hypothetical protein [Sandarakinorhabdus sp.]|uniref:hypothetical protein n=1 Tax=Sandarakinorhabdus sp. TaxID=1916663 RepID=UPI003340269F
MHEMIGIILIGVLNIAMFFWFGYLVSKDPANIFKKRPPPNPLPNEQQGDSKPPQE